MLQTSVVQVSGRGTNVDFAIDDTSPFDQVVSELRKYLEDNRGLWSKGNITVNAGLRMGSREQLTELKRLIEKESGLTVARFWCSSDTVDPASTNTAHNGAPSGPTFPNAEFSGPVPVQHPKGPLPESPAPQAKNPAPEQLAQAVTRVVDAAAPSAASSHAPAPEVSGAAVKSKPSLRPRSQPTVEPLAAAPTVNLDIAEEKVSRARALLTSGAERLQTRSHEEERLEEERTRKGEKLEIEVPAFDHKPGDQLEYQADYLESRRDTALFVKSTCRSGEIIRYSGDVVVLGDVNPGAEIVAGGDITVFGALRGIAHAGSGGLTKAAIIAYRLESPRLQIGPYVGLSTNPGSGGGKGAKSGGPGPVIAFVRRRSIYVAEFAGRFARYSRGILYEG